MSWGSRPFGHTPTEKSPNVNHTTIALVAAKVALGAGLGLGFAVAPQSTAHAAPAGVDAYAWEVGDDNEDGVIEEDESGFSCVDDGNHICGPDNERGVPAGKYDVGGVLMDPWPVDPNAWDGDEYVGGHN